MKIRKYILGSITGLILLLIVSACKDNQKEQEAGETIPTGGTPEIQQIGKQIAEDPQNAALYATRGVLWYENQNYDEGIADLEKAIQLDSTKAEYFHELADMYMDYYKSRFALNVMERAAANFPKRIPTLLKLSEYQLKLKQHNDALFTLQRIKGIDPLNPEMFFMFGNVFVEMGKKDEAIGAYQSAVENEPELIDAWIKLADLIAEKNVALAEKYYDNAIRADSTSIEALHAKAYFLANKKNDLPGAIRLFKKTNLLNPQYTEGYYNAGLIYMDMDSLKQAFASFDLAIKYDPAFAEAYFHRGLVAEKNGNLTQARSDFDNALRLDPEFESAKEALKKLGK